MNGYAIGHIGVYIVDVSCFLGISTSLESALYRNS